MKQDIIKELRRILVPLPDNISDEELLKKTEGTFLRANCELNCAINDFVKTVNKEWNKCCQSINDNWKKVFKDKII